MFSTLVVGYLFLGGAGAGALVVLCLLECVNARRRFGFVVDRTRLGLTFAGRAMTPLRPMAAAGPRSANRARFAGHPRAADPLRVVNHANAGGRSRAAVNHPLVAAFALPVEFFARAWTVCVVVLALGVLCLAADLGRPERVAALILHPQLTAMTVGAYALAASLAVAVAFAAGSNFDGFIPAPSLVYALSAAGVAAGVVVMAYTGVLLASLDSVLFWKTWLLPVVFVLSSLSCGVALAFVAAAFTQTRQNLVRALANLASVDSVLIALEAAALAALLVWGLSGEGTRASAHAIASGDLAPTFWGVVAALGMAVPLVMERFVRHANYGSQLLFVAAFVLAGGLALRWCVVGAGAYDVAQALGQANMLAAGLM
ncbi:MAG: polysulfide reductase NrfD [Eggerthellaceae bacterium]|nr:polysulfide reductase NrfD [Eggerthellaceae bacterium]